MRDKSVFGSVFVVSRITQKSCLYLMLLVDYFGMVTTWEVMIRAFGGRFLKKIK